MSDTPLIIIGAGPAGLSAAIYTARAGVPTLVLGCPPKIAGDYEIDNYFGFTETITGKELMERGRAQAERFGAQIRCAQVVAVHHGDKGGYVVKTKDDSFDACGVIIATGVSRKRPGISNIQDFDGKGVSYCVSCDGFFYRGKKVVVLGEGVFAANQALELLNYTPDVTVCTQGAAPTMGQEFMDKLLEAGIPLLNRKIERLEGSPALERLVFDNGEGMDADGLFIALGEASSLDFAYSLGVERNGVFLVADQEQKTNIPGVFAAGDCLGGFLQISVAVGEGAKAARSAIKHIKETCKDSIKKKPAKKA